MKKFSIIIVLALTIISTKMVSQETFPDTPAGERSKEIMNLLNSGHSDSIKQYIKTSFSESFLNAFPLEQHVDILLQTHEINGQLQLHKISSDEQYRAELVFLSPSTNNLLNLMIDVEESTPYKILRLGFMPGGVYESDHPASKENSSDLQLEKLYQSTGRDPVVFLKNIISKLMDTIDFSGAILVAKDGQPLLEASYGYACKRFDVANNTNTKFNIGSISKHLTSIAILQLAQKGLLDVNDPIGKYLDGFVDSIANKVTIKHLLNMQSGWGDYWDNAYYITHRNDLRTVGEYLDFIKNMPLDFEPGTNRQHSNTGFEVAGAIIEKVSGMDYYNYIRKNVYKPTGMENSGSFYLDGPEKNLATGYTNHHPFDTLHKGYQWSNAHIRIPSRGTPTGGSYSTVADLLKLDQAQRHYQLLNTDYTNYLLNFFQGKPGDPFIMNEGIIQIAGGTEGAGAVVGIDMMDENPAKGYTIIVLSNYDFPVAAEVFETIKNCVYFLKEIQLKQIN